MGKKKIGKYVFPDGNEVEKISEAFKILGLDASAASFQFMVEKAHEDHWTMYDLLLNILESEFANKEESRVTRWIQQAKLQPIATIKDYNFKEQPSIDPAQINDLTSCRFIDEGKNVIFLGPPGVGKTHLALALGLEAIINGYETRCMKLNEFIDAVRRAADTSITRLHRSLVAPRLLILDDIDYYATGEDAGRFLFDVVKQRHENKVSTIITSNKNPKDWGNLFGSPERAGAAMDRLFDQSRRIIININGGSSHRVPSPPEQLASEASPIVVQSKLKHLINSASKSMMRRET